MKKTRLTHLFAAVMAVVPSLAGAWTLERDTSTVTFGSIKNNNVGESHRFQDISGDVDDDGVVALQLALPSIDTRIDIRNERMIEHVFGDATNANIAATIDLPQLEQLEPGESATMEVDALLSFLGTEVDIYLDVFVLRLSEDRVLVTSDAPTYVATEDLGIDGGIDVLKELASLDGITRVSPLSARLIFSR